MKTFTTYAEKKAKQFLNLLQGYTKGIRFTAILILLLMGVNNAWAVNHTGGYVYFLKPSTWTESKVMMFIGHNSYTSVYEMTKVANTDNLYRYTMPSWGGATYVAFANDSYVWGTGNWGPSNRTNAKHYTNVYNNYGFNNGSYYVVVPASTSNNAGITINYKSSASNLNLTTRANVYGSTDGGSTYASMAAAGTVSVSGYYMSNYSTASTRSTVSSTSSQAYASTTLAPGSTATFKATASDGYEFVGWFDAASGGTAVSTSTTYTYKYDISYTGKTVYARFKKQYKILFGVHSSGHGSLTAKVGSTNITNGSRVDYGSTIEFTAKPDEGYQIEGWYKNSDCTTPIDNRTNKTYTVTITGGTNVYVKFVEIPVNSHNITYTAQGTGWTYGDSNPTTAEEGATVTFVVNPTAGYRVDVSSDGPTLTGPNANNQYTFTMPTKDVKITVDAKPEQYNVTLDKRSGTGGTSSVTATYLAAMPTITPPTRTGYTFNGYFDATSGGTKYYNADGSSAKNWDKTSNTTLYAQWTANQYTVTFNKNANDATGTMSNQSFIYDKEKALSENKFQYTGYDFVGWAKSSGGNVEFTNQQSVKNLTTTPNGTVELFAKWTLHEYNIIYNLNGGTNHADNPATYTIETSTITLQAPTHTGYSFAGWYTRNDFSGAPVTEITQGSTGDKTFYAKWIEQKEIYLVGEFGWDNPTEEYKFTAHPTKPGVYTLTKHFNKRDRYDMTDPYGPGQPKYEFKLQVNGTKYTVKTENGKKILQYTRQSKTKVLSDGNNYNSDPYYNLLLQADISGDYVFEYNVESQELTVEHPAYQPEASYIVGDFSDGATGTDALPKDGGAGYDWTEEHGIKFDNDNTAEICFNGTGKTWEFKIKINGVWYGAKDLVITKDGTYTLTDDYAFQSETNCAIQTSGVNGCYTFTYEDNGDGTIDLTVGFPKQSENPTTVYLKPNDEWKAESPFSITYSEETIEMEALDCNGEYYVVEIPAGIPEFQFKNKSGATTLPLSVPADNKVLYDMTSTNITHIYLKPNSNWLQAGAKFEAYFWNNNGNDWVTMEHIGNNIYQSEKKRNNVLFYRIDPKDGYNKWSKTKDLVVPSNGTNLFEIDKNASTDLNQLADGKWYTLWDNSKWTTYTEPTYDVTINITGKGAIVINGQTYEGTSEETTTLTIEDIVVNQALTVTAITPADRWIYEGDATITIGSNKLELLKVEGPYEICGPTTINLDFMQKYCLVTFLPNPPRGLVYPEQINPQVVVKGKKAVQPTIVELEGYLFAGWYPNGSTYTDANKFDFDTPIEQDIELCARWVPYEQCIFFKNNLNWDNIYVYTFKGDVWGDDGKGVYPANRYEYGKMTQIGYTDVYYYILTQPDGFNHIAFSDYDMHDYELFWGYSAIYRGDRSDKMQLFIPQKDQKPTRAKDSTTEYYSEGIWMKYNSTESGYKWSSDKNGWSTDINPFTAPNKGGYSFTTKVSLQGGTEYKFKVNNINGDWYGKIHTMTKENCTNLWLEHRMEPEYNTTIQPNVTGEYIFTIYLGDGKVMISLEYPLDINDYRLAYNDNTTGFHPGHYIRKRLTEEQLDTVSFFVHKDYSPELLLQKCIAIDAVKGIATWETVGEAYPIDVNSTSVYNFVLQQTGTTEATHQATVLMDKTHLYTGNFYIRTDKAPGGWDYFRQEDNMIHFSSYASDHEHFTHYFCKWIESSEQKGYSNVKYTIANDYSYCISDTLDNDDVIKNNQTEQGFLPANANVRFTWNNKDNTLSRAYISGSTWTRDRFLVLSGNEQLFDINIDDETGDPLSFPEGTTNGSRDGLHANEAIFADMGNWIYQLDVHANNQTKIKLTALYNEVVQYFKGSEKEPTALLRSTEGKNYKIRLIYDFKINKLISAWLAGDETIEGQDQTLGADMMIIRHNQEKAEQLNFDPTSRQLSEVGTAYAVMTFDKYFLNNRAEDGSHLSDADKQSPYARALYWISFPFDVKLNEVFGFGEYGDYWIMEYYDGEARAKNGLWADTDTYWKYITNKNYILQKGQGYVISLNLNKMGYESNIFDNTDEVSLYFPSNGALGTITGVPTNYDAPAHECTIDRENGIHKIYDSHWNVIGVPGFADIENVNVEGHIFTQDSIHFYYEYLPQTNEYRTRRAGGDKTPANFQTMYSYMVQYYGGINWSTKTFTRPSAIAARRTGEMPSQYDLRLELTTDDQLHDQTFLLLDEDKRATAEYDVNLDLTKIMNKNASIYTLAGEQRITLSGNTLPMEKAIVPVGVRIATAGEYTFRTPDGTDGISVTLVDNVTGTHTDMLMDEYTITLDAGTIENRFYLVVDPDRTATSVENIGEEAKGEEAKDQIKKFLIDGKLFIRTADGIFDAKGQRL